MTFLGLSLEVRRGVFIPKRSAEFLAVQAIRRLRGRRAPVHVDIGSGAGAVALAVAHAVAHARVMGLDRSRPAVRLACTNAARVGLSGVLFVESDLFAAAPPDLRGRVDVVTANLPYVAPGDLQLLPDEVWRFEPVGALTDFSSSGLELAGRAIDASREWLRPGGWLLFQVSSDLSRTVTGMMRRAGLRDVRPTAGGRGYVRRAYRVLVGRR